MDIYMVGVYKKGKKIEGFRMLDPNTTDTSKQIMDVGYNQVVSVIQSKKANIINLKLENGKLKGYNGSIDRYGVIGKSQALVILRKAVDANDNMLGYICSDCNGNMRLLSEKQVIDFANKIALANGKVITDAAGKSYISAIEGTYQTYKKPTQHQNNKTQNQNQEQPRTHVNSVDTEVVTLLNKLQSFKEYKGSYAEKIANTIKKLNRCTPKQKACLEKILSDFEKNRKTPEQPVKAPDKTPEQLTKAPEQPSSLDKQTSIKNEPKNEIKATNKKMIPTDSNLFALEVMNNQLYIKKFKSNKDSNVTDLVIPDTLEYEGKTYQVSGISAYAFAKTHIENVTTGPNIIDIGQSAFDSCYKLRNVDLSASKHPHIAMYCFRGCEKLQNIKVGNYVQRIHEGAFADCKELSFIELPDSTDTVARVAFINCVKLEKVKSKVTTINDSAFRDCKKLKDFDFSSVITIGSHAFRHTGFEKLILPGNITSIGSKAFSDMPELKEVELEEGIEALGEYCFAKSRTDINGKKNALINSILTCKSLKEIGNDAFRHSELVKVYTGSVAESHCIGFDVPYVRLDGTTKDNSTRVRIKSELIDSNPMLTLKALLEEPSEDASNPAIELNTSKLVDIAFNEQNFNFFHIEPTTAYIQPHAKFIGLVNYLQDVSDLYTTPMANSVLRLQKTYNVDCHQIYSDGCNRAYKVMYSLMDTLEEGGFIMIIMNNHLRFVAELTIATDVSMSNCIATDENIPIQKFIHAGDKIGKTSTISGHNGVIIEEGNKVNVGEAFFNRINEHCIEITPQRKDSIWYVPATGLALKLHDKREWERDNYSASGKRVSRKTQDCLNVLEVLNYEDLIDNAKTYRKHTIDSNKFFKNLTTMSDKEVNKRIDFMSSVEEEKEAQLFHVSKEFSNILQFKNKNIDAATPNDLTIELFNEISQSYWMIEKDQNWLRLTGQKSLNKTNEYTIDGYKLVEYKSNQVVKFSNPYMNGQKGAYVFTLMKNGRTYGVYASRHSMQQIIKKLCDLTNMKPETTPINLMTNAYEIDMCTHDLFYNFYDVLYSKDGWNFKNYINGYIRQLWNLSADFHIAMYKPTGIFYLTMEAYVRTGDKTSGRRTMPILPIGNMDRALMIATTTNSKNKDSKLLEELMILSATIIIGHDNLSRISFNKVVDVEAYYKVRELAIQGVKDISLYKQLVNDRVAYMLGTVHKGVLQREHESRDIEIEVDTEDKELYDLADDSDIEYSIDESEYEEYESPDNEEIDIDIDLDEYEDNTEDEGSTEDEDEYDITYGEDIDTGNNSTTISDSDARVLQQQLKEAGHNLSLEQVKLMMIQQL